MLIAETNRRVTCNPFTQTRDAIADVRKIRRFLKISTRVHYQFYLFAFFILNILKREGIQSNSKGQCIIASAFLNTMCTCSLNIHSASRSHSFV